MSLDVLFGIGVLTTRLLHILAGVVLCVLGYRLFLQVPTSEGHAEVTLSEHLKLHLSKVGPGVFFALFGAAILLQSLANPLRFERASEASSAVTTSERVMIAGQRQVTNSTTALSAEELLRQMRFMNNLSSLLAAGLSIEQRVTVENGLREAKLAIIANSWENRWGDFAHFSSWARGQSSSAPSAEAKRMWETK